MRKIISILLLAAIIPLFVTTSCRKYEDANEYAILVDYMTANAKDFNTLSNGLVTGAALTTATPTAGIVNAADNYSIPGWTIIDIRDAATFNNGHIKGAQNIPLANIITAAPTDKATKILVVCFSGQTAARAAMILRMAGYTNAKFLKWGMSAWNPLLQILGIPMQRNMQPQTGLLQQPLLYQNMEPQPYLPAKQRAKKS